MGRIPVKAILIEFWKNNEGKPCNIQDIKLTGLTEAQIKAGMNNLRSNDRDWFNDHFKILVQGNTWVYHSRAQPIEKAPNKGLSYRQVGTSVNGDIIVSSPDGTLYRLREI